MKTSNYFSAERSGLLEELIGQSGFGPDEGGDFNLFGVEGWKIRWF